VWLPSYQGVTNSHYRNLWYIGPIPASENGAKVASILPADVVEGWRRHGWDDDPLKTQWHCGNMLDPRWRHMGVAWNGWGKGLRSVFAEFSE
jgi:uncharacterized protein YkwD